MLTLYSLLIRLALPVMVLRLLLRSRQNADYRARLLERLALMQRPPAPTAQARVWIHAVSVGETLAIAPLIEQVLARVPDRRVLITSTTPTGAAQVQRLFGDRVDHAWVPFDTPGAVNRFLEHWQPAMVALVETEIWPNIILLSRRRGLPVLLLNARLSRRSARGYGRLLPLAQPVLQAISHIASQQRADARRFRALGVAPGHISVVGSVKFDLDIVGLMQQRDQLAQQLRLTEAGLKQGRPVWLAASTHEGEDEQVLAAFQRLRESEPQALLMLAPRHPERCAAVARVVASMGLSQQRRSEQRHVADDTDVLLIDTLGELSAMVGLADVVFVGGSLVPHGGHNPLEAAAFGVPVLTGPGVTNFAVIYRAMVRANGALMVADAEALAEAVVTLLKNDAQRAAIGAAGRHYLEANQGALERQYTLIQSLLKP